jgi:hypothetical protein
MTAFETAWDLLKTDMRLPTPLDRPQFTDAHANLAFRGSRIPDFRAFDAGNNQNVSESQFMESVTHELQRRRGERMDNPPVIDYEMGDFTENMKEGIEDKSYRYGSDEARMFKPQSEMGTEVLMGELERASLINALNEAGIFDTQSLERIADQAFQYMDAGIAPYSHQGRRMNNDKGEYMRRTFE